MLRVELDVLSQTNSDTDSPYISEAKKLSQWRAMGTRSLRMEIKRKIKLRFLNDLISLKFKLNKSVFLFSGEVAENS